MWSAPTELLLPHWLQPDLPRYLILSMHVGFYSAEAGTGMRRALARRIQYTGVVICALCTVQHCMLSMCLVKKFGAGFG